MAIPQSGSLGASKSGRKSFGSLLVKALVIAVAIFALASPIWVVFHGMSYLNQAPPPYWQMNAGQGGAGAHSGPAGLGGC